MRRCFPHPLPEEILGQNIEFQVTADLIPSSDPRRPRPMITATYGAYSITSSSKVCLVSPEVLRRTREYALAWMHLEIVAKPSAMDFSLLPLDDAQGPAFNPMNGVLILRAISQTEEDLLSLEAGNLVENKFGVRLAFPDTASVFQSTSVKQEKERGWFEQLGDGLLGFYNSISTFFMAWTLISALLISALPNTSETPATLYSSGLGAVERYHCLLRLFGPLGFLPLTRVGKYGLPTIPSSVQRIQELPAHSFDAPPWKHHADKGEQMVMVTRRHHNNRRPIPFLQWSFDVLGSFAGILGSGIVWAGAPTITATQWRVCRNWRKRSKVSGEGSPWSKTRRNW